MVTKIKLSDSMSAIQSKLNKGGTVIFSPGVYKITKQLIIPEGTVVDLNGATLQRKASIQSIFLNKVTKNTTGYNGAGNITIKNGTLEGMGGYSYDNLLTLFHSHDVVISNCTFKDILCHAIELNSSCRCRVESCQFLGYNLKSVSDAYKECVQIDHAGYSGFVLSGSTSKSKCYDGTCCQSISIVGNLFTKSAYRDYPYVCIGEHSQLRGANYKHRDILIQGNEFHCKKNPELKQACISITSMEDVRVLENAFDCLRVARIYSKAYSYKPNGTQVDAKNGDGICINVEISKNKISGCTKKESFQIYNKSGDIDHVNISKNDNEWS